MKRLFSIILVIIFAGLVLLRWTDSSICIADTGIRYNELANGVSNVSNSSASATITMRVI